jgi:P4 family phage/plasmid primase-like protien
MSDTLTFLQAIYSNAGSGYVNLWTLPDRASHWFPVSKIDQAAPKAVALANDRNVYVSTGIYAAPLSEGRGGAEDVVAIPGLRLEFDVQGEGHAGTNFPPDREAVLALIGRFEHSPTILLDSGHGLQAWWLFKEPWTFGSPEERATGATMMRRLQHWFQEQARERGWKIDATADLPRVLRVPGTVNRKPGLPPVPVVLLHCDETVRYNPSDFDWLPEVEQGAATENRSRPDPAPLDLDDAALLDKARGAVNGDLFRRLYDQGDTSAHGGDDSAADLALCNLLAFWTRRDAARMDRLFQQSALYRGEGRAEKWCSRRNDTTYGRITIDHAIGSCQRDYSPNYQAPEGRRNKMTGKNGAVSNGSGTPSTAPASDEQHPVHETDLGNSTRLVRWFGADLRHSKTHGWLSFDGRRWIGGAGGENAAAQAAKATVRRMYAEAGGEDADAERKTLARWALQSESAIRLNAMVGLARTEAAIAVQAEQLDANPWLLNVENGTIDLRTGALRDHHREDYITKLIPIPYDPAATCPAFERFALEIMNGREELVTYLQRSIGYTLSGDVSEQVLQFLHGSGANGKSTLLRVLLALMGDYGTQAAPGLLLESRGDRHPTERADLAGKRLVVSVEVGEGKRMAEELVKQLTGGDRIKGRFMRADFFEFEPEFKLWLAANHKPIIRGTDHAIWRRIPLLPFDVTFTDDPEDGNPDKDQHLTEKLMEELPGILAWAVRGCLEWQRQGLNPPEAVVKATRDYRAEMDILADFFEDHCIFGDPKKFQVRSADLYEAYRGWCVNAGERPISKKALATALQERGCENQRDKVSRWWLGVGLVKTPTPSGNGNGSGDRGAFRDTADDAFDDAFDDASAPMTRDDAFFGITGKFSFHEGLI